MPVLFSHQWRHWCPNFQVFLNIIVKFSGKRLKIHLLGSDTDPDPSDPDRHALNADPDPKPANNDADPTRPGSASTKLLETAAGLQ
jgi:hypothetical protein